MIVPVDPIAALPVAVAEAKADLRIDHANDDTLLARHVAVATQWVEKVTGQTLAAQQWEWTVEDQDINGADLEIPLRPVISVDEISLDAVVYDAADYIVSRLGSDQGSSIAFVSSANSWTKGAVVTFTSGSDPVPEPLRHAIIYGVKILYDGGDLNSDGTLRALMWPYQLQYA